MKLFLIFITHKESFFLILSIHEQNILTLKYLNCAHFITLNDFLSIMQYYSLSTPKTIPSQWITLWHFVQTRILWHLPVFSFRMKMYECVYSCLYMYLLYTFTFPLCLSFLILYNFHQSTQSIEFNIMIRNLQNYTIHTRIWMLLQNVTKWLWCVTKSTWWERVS